MATEPKDLQDFITCYTAHVGEVLQPARERVEHILNGWREPGYWRKYATKSRLSDPSPIQRIRTRIKHPASVVDKILQNPTTFPSGLKPDSLQRVDDALGARVVVYFLTGLPLVDQELRKSEHFEISQSDPPVAYMSAELAQRLGLAHLGRRVKESGYAAIHYTLRLLDAEAPQDRQPWFELQVRTLVQDAWAQIEEILGYKPAKKTSFAVSKQFKIIAAELTAIDEHFNFLYEELLCFQEEVVFEDHDPLNAENLPPVLAGLGLGCAQQELDGLLKLLVSRGITTVGHLQKSASVRRIEIIRNTYRNEQGQAPRDYEVVASLAASADLTDDEDLAQRVKAHVTYLREWEAVKRQFRDL